VAGAQHRSEWLIDVFQQVDRERLRISLTAEFGDAAFTSRPNAAGSAKAVGRPDDRFLWVRLLFGAGRFLLAYFVRSWPILLQNWLERRGEA